MKKAFLIVLLCIASCTNDNNVEDDKNIVTGLLTGQTLSHDNLTREYILYVPDTYDGKTEVPLMMNFHGGGGDAAGQMQVSDMRPIADTANFILVYPQGSTLDSDGSGSKGDTHWNSSLSSDNTSKSSTDDFGFISALITKISSDYRIDPNRIYACGFSNGGDFSHALACALSDKITAIASVAGLLSKHTSENTNPSPTSILSIHGTADNIRPHDASGGYEPYYLSNDNMLQYWVTRNSTKATPTITNFTSKGLSVEHYNYTGGNKNTSMEYYKVTGADHYWIDITRESLNTDQLIWNFVSKHRSDPTQ